MTVTKNNIMKKSLLITLMFISIQVMNAQSNILNPEECSINGSAFLGKNVSFLHQTLGNPNVIEDYYFEMDEITSKKHLYNGATFYVVDGKVYSFEIFSSNYNFSNNNIKIGNSISVINNYYPTSFANRKDSAIKLNIKNLDRFVIISYENNTIDKISIFSY